jgi:hypothetical protein
MSLRCCQHLGRDLPAAETCGARCSDFPACLPPVPRLPVLLQARELDDAQAVDDALRHVHAAILRGLERE